MNTPDANTLYDVIDTTWPAADRHTCGPFTLRHGANGGSRVSAAHADGQASDDDIRIAAQSMQAMDQPALFMIRLGDDAFDAQLDRLGYVIKDPVAMYSAPVDALTGTALPAKTAFPVWPPLAAQREIWTQGGIGQSRIDVMTRAKGPKTTILGRIDDQPAGTVYVGIAGTCAMLHALEIGNEFRRRGLARHLTQACAFWARDNGAHDMTLVTTEANDGANALYTSLGMALVGHYHYRILPEATS